jgi:magnesium transporter
MSEMYCYRLVARGKVGIASLDQVRDQETLHWIHIAGDPDESCQQQLIDDLGVDPSLAAVAVRTTPSQRPFHLNGSLAFTLSLPAESQDQCRSSLLGVVASGCRLITLSSGPSSLAQDLMQDWLEDPDGVGETPEALLFSLVDHVADSYTPLVDDIHDRVEALEVQVFEEVIVGPEAAIGIKRELLNIRRDAAPLRDAMQAILRHGQPWCSPARSIHYQDTLTHLMRTMESLDIARDIVSSIMDAQVAMAGNRLNQNMRILTVISTVLMSGSLVAGIYGMNVGLWPPASTPWGFPLALGIMVLASAGAFWAFKAKGWV